MNEWNKILANLWVVVDSTKKWVVGILTDVSRWGKLRADEHLKIIDGKVVESYGNSIEKISLNELSEDQVKLMKHFEWKLWKNVEVFKLQGMIIIDWESYTWKDWENYSAVIIKDKEWWDRYMNNEIMNIEAKWEYAAFKNSWPIFAKWEYQVDNKWDKIFLFTATKYIEYKKKKN